MVYEKSLAGLQEIADPARKLNARQRQVLILIDGKRSRDDLEKYLNRLNVAEIINDLEQLGYIHDPRNPRSGNSPAIAAQEEKPEPSDISEEQFLAVQSLMIASTNKNLGLMGRNVVDQIKLAATQEQLKSCISLWNMALRESRKGHAIADDLMKQVQQILSAQDEPATH